MAPTLGQSEASERTEERSVLDAVRATLRAAREQPAFALYLLALAALGFKWLSPISSLYERAGWSDLLIAAAAGTWLVEHARSRSLPRLRSFHLLLIGFIGITLISAAFAESQGTGARNLLLVAELAVLAFLSSEFAGDRDCLAGIVLVVTGITLITGVLAVVGLALFYANVNSSLIGQYGEQFIASDRYTRVAAGFESPPLLASFSIFASAMVAQEDGPLPRKLRLGTQVVLTLLVFSTLSRGAIGFLAAMAIRNSAGRPGSLGAKRLAIGAVVGAVLLMGVLSVGRLHLDPTRPDTINYELPDPGNRRQAFVTGLETLGDHPFLGKGPGSLVAMNGFEPFRAHFTPLNVAATTGIPALLILVGLLAMLWRDRRRPTPVATWSGLAGLGIDGLGQDVEHFRHVWVLIGVADAQRRDPQKSG